MLNGGNKGKKEMNESLTAESSIEMKEIDDKTIDA